MIRCYPTLSSLLKRNSSGRFAASFPGQSNRGPSAHGGGLRRKGLSWKPVTANGVTGRLKTVKHSAQSFAESNTKQLRQSELFLDPRSKVRHGRTILKGLDMELLRWRVFWRCNGYCEAKSHASACTLWVAWENGNLHHVKRRGMGGANRDDVESNLLWLSQACHREAHS